MRILPLSQSFQAKKINLKIISPEDTKEFNYKMQKVLAEYKHKSLRTLENAKNVFIK